MVKWGHNMCVSNVFSDGSTKFWLSDHPLRGFAQNPIKFCFLRTPEPKEARNQITRGLRALLLHISVWLVVMNLWTIRAGEC